ncbi:MAG: type II toxin-antitoxin system RelE/ParE family toxin [Chloroflexi bacterium]|nr:type II toxin-antitoxin system RelE/ParE family toxin [Chloroflexota bacterium]
MSYDLLIRRAAQKELAALPATEFSRVESAIRTLADEPRPRSSRKLAARDGWRMRVGRYRVVYEIDDEVRSVTILHVGHRRDVYR